LAWPAVIRRTWVVVPLGSTFHVENFGSYNETYGGLGGAVILVPWFCVAAPSIIMCAEIDAELERYARLGDAADAVGP
jgi:membrane protein